MSVQTVQEKHPSALEPGVLTMNVLLSFLGNHRPANHHIFGRNAEHSNYRGIDLADCF